MSCKMDCAVFVGLRCGCLLMQGMHRTQDLAAADRELRTLVALLQRLLVCEPTLALELPKLELGHAAVDVLTLLTRVLDAAAALAQPDLNLLGADATSCVEGVMWSSCACDHGIATACVDADHYDI